MTRKFCQKRAIVGYEEIKTGMEVSEGQWVFREAKLVPVWETWCGVKVAVSGSMEIDEGEPLPGVACEECRKAKAAAGGDVEEPPKA